jgi:hypothetical protein
MTPLVIGIDPHSRIHVAAALDEHGRCLHRCEVGAAPEQLGQPIDWIAGFDVVKVAVEGSKGYGLPLARLLVAVEGSKGLGLPLARLLVAAGYVVVDRHR